MTQRREQNENPMSGGSAWLVMLAALFWGLSGGVAGLLMAEGWEPFVVSLYRGAIGLVCVAVWLLLRPGESGLGNPRLWFWSAIAGIGVAGNFSFYFISIAEGSIAVAATLMYCAPVFVYLVSFLLKLERPTPVKWMAMVLVMAGIALLTRIYDIDTSGVTPLAIGAGLLSGLSYTLFIFGFRYAAPHGSPQAILTVAFSAFTAILIWPADAGQAAAVPNSPDLPLFAALGMFGAGLSFFFYITGLRHTEPAVASVVAMIEPVTAALFGVAVLSETLGGLQLVGMALILLTVTWLSVSS
ncbi:DMT family transporter [Prosthecochloris sp. ZM_2]|uniref:DMT family transporter n=1 Tax=Prosthecochloris sp. ZM_2 TaxID=2045206 RepID=UPI0018F511FC|nr:DMT family transporter [Prosthecochloris sp. ZM_2]